MALYCFAASVPFKVGSASIAAKASNFSRIGFGWHVRWLWDVGSGVVGKKFAYCWLLRIAGPYPICEARLGDGC
jgi:hypothetical protein